MAYNAIDTGVPCKYCGDTYRYKFTHQCVHCNRIKAALKISKRMGAVEDRMPKKIADEEKVMKGVLYD